LALAMAGGAVPGGTISHLRGGKFGHGFASASDSAATLVGGTLSRISGGNFANGALTAAMSYAFNHLAHESLFADGAEPPTRDVAFVPTDRDGLYPYDVYVFQDGNPIAGPYQGSIYPDQSRANCGSGLCPTIAAGAYPYVRARSPGGWGRGGFLGLQLGDVTTRSPNLSLNAIGQGHYGRNLARGVYVHPGARASTTSEGCLTVRRTDYGAFMSHFPRGVTGSVMVMPDWVGGLYNPVRPRQFD
jgi:hypothetical protein